MEKYLGILEHDKEVEIDADKLKYMVSQISVWDHFGISKFHYSIKPQEEKERMLKTFYAENLNVYFGTGKLGSEIFFFPACFSLFSMF